MAEKEVNRFSDYVADPFSRWWDYIRGNVGRYYLSLLSIEFLNLFIKGLILVFFGAIVFGLVLALGGLEALVQQFGAFYTIIALLAALLVFGAVALLLISWVQQTLGLVICAYTNAELTGKKFSIFEAANRLKGRALRLLLVESAIWFVLLLPITVFGAIIMTLLFGLILLSVSSAFALTGILVLLPVFMATYLIGIIYIILVNLIYGFLAQFWRYGVAVEELGVIAALKKSVSIVKARPFETFTFDVLWIAGVTFFSTPALIYAIIWRFGWEALNFTAVQLDLVTMVEAYGVALVLNAVLSVILATITTTFSLPTLYFFWKKVKDSGPP